MGPGPLCEPPNYTGSASFIARDRKISASLRSKGFPFLEVNLLLSPSPASDINPEISFGKKFSVSLLKPLFT
jgi:hypothetical protein